MPEERRPLFRQYAMQQYVQRRSRDTLPRIVSPPVFTLAWVLIGLLLLAATVAWWQRVPTYTEGSGVIVTEGGGGSDTRAVIFLPVAELQQIRTGGPGFVQVNGGTEYVQGVVVQQATHVVTPAQAQQQYQFACGTSQVITQPSLAVVLKFVSPAGMQISQGALVQARVQTGSQRVIALLPGLGFTGGGS